MSGIIVVGGTVHRFGIFAPKRFFTSFFLVEKTTKFDGRAAAMFEMPKLQYTRGHMVTKDKKFRVVCIFFLHNCHLNYQSYFFILDVLINFNMRCSSYLTLGACGVACVNTQNVVIFY